MAGKTNELTSQSRSACFVFLVTRAGSSFPGSPGSIPTAGRTLRASIRRREPSERRPRHLVRVARLAQARRRRDRGQKLYHPDYCLSFREEKSQGLCHGLSIRGAKGGL